MRLKPGEIYLRRDGKLTGPLEYNKGITAPYAPFYDPKYDNAYLRDGRHKAEKQSRKDIVSPAPKDGSEGLLGLIEQELKTAQTSYPAFHSAHEGYAVLKEEVDELWEAVRKKQGTTGRPEAIRAEAVQVAAMAIRIILDCCEPEAPAYNK